MAINEVGNKSSGINRRPHLCTLRGRALGGGHAKAMSITGAACTGIFAKRYFFYRTRCECARPTRRHVKKDPYYRANTEEEREIDPGTTTAPYLPRPIGRSFVFTELDSLPSQSAYGPICYYRTFSFSFMSHNASLENASVNETFIASCIITMKLSSSRWAR